MVMVRTIGLSMLFLLLAMCVVQFLGATCSVECLHHWSASPVQAHEQLPGSLDGQTELDQGEGELEELALAPGEGFRLVHLARTCVLDHTTCPRTNFASDLFRPPARA
jgi:hypothetical protein